jgi:hypothetical protein
MMRHATLLATALALAGCIKTEVMIDQKKPIEVNINFKGDLNLVIKDARQDMEKITGEKPVNVVRPEDLGLPPAAGSALEPMETRALAAADTERFWVVAMRSAPSAARVRAAPVALKDDLQAKMAARDREIRALWDSQVVGEAHDGMLAVKGTITPAQQALVNAENADRAALFAEEVKAKGAKLEDVSLAFYVARLGYAKKGAWYEKRNASGAWEWQRWGQ